MAPQPQDPTVYCLPGTDPMKVALHNAFMREEAERKRESERNGKQQNQKRSSRYS